MVLAAALCFSTSAIAEVTCHTDAFGDVNCTGYDKDGNYVNTTSHKDAFGDVTTTGHIGNSNCLLYTSPSPRDAHESRMPSSA